MADPIPSKPQLPRSIRYEDLAAAGRAAMAADDLHLVAGQFPGVGDALKYTPRAQHHKIADRIVLELGLSELESRIAAVKEAKGAQAKPSK